MYTYIIHVYFLSYTRYTGDTHTFNIGYILYIHTKDTSLLVIYYETSWYFVYDALLVLTRLCSLSRSIILPCLKLVRLFVRIFSSNCSDSPSFWTNYPLDLFFSQVYYHVQQDVIRSPSFSCHHPSYSFVSPAENCSVFIDCVMSDEGASPSPNSLYGIIDYFNNISPFSLLHCRFWHV